MVQPALLEYSFHREGPQAVTLSLTAMKQDVILLMDAFFHVVVWRGESIQRWYSAGYQDHEQHVNFKELLRAPAEDCKAIIANRFPVPRYVQTNARGSGERFVKAKVDPSDRSQDDALMWSDDVSLKTFMEHLIKLAVEA